MNWTERLSGKLNLGEMDAWAAVAILISSSEEGLEALLVKRATVQGDPWSGDMAFPGGKRTTSDESLRSTVYREVLEETNIDLNKIEYLGTMPVIFSAMRSNMSVLPILYKCEEKPQISLNYELTSYRWILLNELKEKKGVAIVKGWEGPVFKFGDDIVWGLTYRMLEKLLDLLEL